MHDGGTWEPTPPSGRFGYESNKNKSTFPIINLILIIIIILSSIGGFGYVFKNNSSMSSDDIKFHKVESYYDRDTSITIHVYRDEKGSFIYMNDKGYMVVK